MLRRLDNNPFMNNLVDEHFSHKMSAMARVRTKWFPKKGKGKSKNEAKRKGPIARPHALPRFDLKRISPSRSIVSWPMVAASLENGEAPQSAGIAVCNATSRIVELQELAIARKISFKIVLVATLSADEEEADFNHGGKSKVLHFQINIAYVKAPVASLDRTTPDLAGEILFWSNRLTKLLSLRIELLCA